MTAFPTPWRPLYEGYAALAWLGGLILLLWHGTRGDLPRAPLGVLAAICALMALVRGLPALRLWRQQRRLRGPSLTLLPLAQLQRRGARRPDAVWLGWGFEWQPTHTQRVYELVADHPALLPQDAPGGAIGAPWLHGVATRETDLWLPLEHQAGHLLLVGTTGSFKTQALILLISQAILRGEAVLVIDPKGDRALWRAMQAACQRAGRPQAAHYFHPAFPERSIRLDPLRNFANPTELASRVAALIPSETGLDPWKAFGWKTVNDIVAGLLVVDERPNLVKIRRYVEGGAERLLRRALQRYSDRLAALVKATPPPIDAELSVHIQFYQTVLAPVYPSLGLDGLMALARHNREHFGKMVASLIPVLAMLTAPPLDALLSPDPQEANDPRPLTDLARLLDTQQAVYVGLDTLPNATVGSAIGSLLLADLTASLGARYNYRDRFTPITVVVDEAAEVLNEPFIQLLNKGRGAGARAILATQTLGDFEARLASPARARQVLGNVNNRLIGRVLDPETQRYLADGLPKTRLRRLIAAQGDTADSTQPLAFSGGYSETLQEEEAPLFAPEWLGLLPNLQYIALLSGHRIVKGRLPILALPATPAPETPVT